jgi:menaquinone-dependent protoporphyrinogen oxidase
LKPNKKALNSPYLQTHSGNFLTKSNRRMKTLIVYMSHHGTTRKTAQWLHQRLGIRSTVIVDLEKDSLPDLAQFSTVLIGGSIHFGHIQKKLHRFCEENLDILLSKKIGLFLCFIDRENSVKEFNHAFPVKLQDHACAKGFFGGELLFSQMNFLEKLATKPIGRNDEPVTELNTQNMLSFVKVFKEVK